MLALGAEQVTAGELAKLSIEDLTRLFAELTRNLRLLMVFDNVDHHVDLERRVLIGAPGRFLATFRSLNSSAQVIFTYRPGVKVEDEDTMSIALDGLRFVHTVNLMLRPIWETLEDRPKIVLQVLAEAVKPTSALELSDYLGSRLRYAKATRVIDILKARNLLVVRRQDWARPGGSTGPTAPPGRSSRARRLDPGATYRSETRLRFGLS